MQLGLLMHIGQRDIPYHLMALPVYKLGQKLVRGQCLGMVGCHSADGELLALCILILLLVLLVLLLLVPLSFLSYYSVSLSQLTNLTFSPPVLSPIPLVCCRGIE